MNKIKEEIFKNCKEYVQRRYATITDIISSHKKALQSETKSSAGDKHETGRAMLQLEMEKASLQLSSINQMLEVMDKIKLEYSNDTIRLGSLVISSLGKYFLAISAGEMIVKNHTIYVVSPSSPIGKALLGKLKGDSISFNGNEIKILEIH